MTGSKLRSNIPVLRVLAALATLAILGTTAPARATQTEVQGPRQQAQQLITELEGKTDQRALVDGALNRARSALNRATQARRSKQLEQAATLERVALSWAQLGQLLLKTVALEADATKLEMLQNDLDIRIKRARALLEETLARRARAQETLKKLEQPTPAAPPAASQPATAPANSAAASSVAPKTPAPQTPAPQTPAPQAPAPQAPTPKAKP